MMVTTRARKFLLFSQAAASLVALLGILVLFGWVFNIGVLKSVAPGLVSMKANTAVSLMTLGTALFLLNERYCNTARKRTSLLLALAVTGLAGLTLLQYVLNLDLGIDQLLFHDDTRATATSHPGRMAPVTALCLLLVSLALLRLDRGRRSSRYTAMVVLVLAMLGIAGYVFGVESLYRVSTFTSMAIHTAVALALLSLGVITSRTRKGWMDVILSDTAGGVVARRLLWLIPLLLFVIGWLSIRGEASGFYDGRFGLAITVIGGMVVAAMLIMGVAALLKVADTQRHEAEEQLVALNARLEETVVERTRALEDANRHLSEEIAYRKQAEEEVRRLSVTDDLTGLLNRRGFLLLAEQDLRAAKRAQAVRAMIYLDLDGLKRVNDTYGHKAGDALLIDAAGVLTTCFRESDIVARLGGDEFAVLAAKGENEEIMVSRLQAITSQFNKHGSPAHQLSFSIGVVRCLPDSGKPLLELLAEADALMYEQKRSRRREH
jgi:diguanylate cyclase (GGDEF)-like protein